MSRLSIQELRRMGVSREDIDAALTTQAAQRRNGSPVQSIGVIVGAVQQRPRHNPNPPVSLTDRAMRKRGTYDQAALLLTSRPLQNAAPNVPCWRVRRRRSPKTCQRRNNSNSTFLEGATCPSHSNIRTP